MRIVPAIKLYLLVQFLFLNFDSVAQDPLRKNIAEIIRSVKADVGVAIKHLETGDTLTFSGKYHFPMQSVFKFHLALAVLDRVEKGKFSMDQKINIRKSDYIPNTWSPIAKKYPEGDVALSVSELLSYTVSHSDNNSCDVLFRMVGGPSEVEKYIHGLGVTNMAIANTEEEMHKSWDVQFNNWSEPWAMVQLLELFNNNKILSKSNHDLLMGMMVKTITGGKRIKGLLPEGTVVAHRTGMGAPNDKGILGALNNVGIVTLPNGKHFAIAIFISNTSEDPNRLEEVIAKISKIVFDHYSLKG